jgi:flagellar hook protein FlgE
MLRSMFTAISALKLHQSFLDVVSDNLANANTPGFKASRVLFQDQYAQILNAGSAPTATTGGINPTQIGLGLQMGYVTPIFTQGMLQSSGRNLDLAIQGDGFFMYNSPNGMHYSREGSLQIDANGYMVNGGTGLRIQGWTLPSGTPGPVPINTTPGDIHIELNKTLAHATSSVSLGGNLDSKTLTDGTGTYEVTFGAFDSLGKSVPVTVQFTRTTDSDTSWDWKVTGPSSASGGGSISFDDKGQIKTPSSFTDAIKITGSNGAAETTITPNMSGLTMLSAANTVASTSQDGLAAGTVSDILISPNTGEIYLLYSNGLRELSGQIALAKFTNPSGLMREGHNLYQAGLNSGTPAVGAANEGGRGAMVSGYTEGSNVDMAQEFTNMILAERGFQASSRVITTSDEIIQELVNLKR